MPVRNVASTRLTASSVDTRGSEVSASITQTVESSLSSLVDPLNGQAPCLWDVVNTRDIRPRVRRCAASTYLPMILQRKRISFICSIQQSSNTDRIQFRIAVTVYRCLHGTAPEYLSELFVPASTRSSRHCLRSSDSNKLVVVPPVKQSTYGRRSFTASGPIVWNSLPEYPRDPTLSVDIFRRYLKHTFCSILRYTRRLSALETLCLHALYKFFLLWLWLLWSRGFL